MTLKRCPVCGEKWAQHIEEGSILISPQAFQGPPSVTNIVANACYVRFSWYETMKAQMKSEPPVMTPGVPDDEEDELEAKRMAEAMGYGKGG